MQWQLASLTHQQVRYVTCSYVKNIEEPRIVTIPIHSMYAIYAYLGVVLRGQCRHIWQSHVLCLGYIVQRLSSSASGHVAPVETITVSAAQDTRDQQHSSGVHPTQLTFWKLNIPLGLQSGPFKLTPNTFSEGTWSPRVLVLDASGSYGTSPHKEDSLVKTSKPKGLMDGVRPPPAPPDAAPDRPLRVIPLGRTAPWLRPRSTCLAPFGRVSAGARRSVRFGRLTPRVVATNDVGSFKVISGC